MSPEEHAAASGDLAAVQRWRASSLPEPIGSSGTTLLQWAALGGQTPVAVFLLDSGADPNARDAFGDTALHSATVACRTDVMRLLLSRGANPELRNRRGDRALDMASRAGAPDLVRVLQP
ncbi:ankyrin repeat domain-containing protein [Elioraea rosea]|uniref:ankyrin repeat domain-containing protein n=1 Tax=Elioraea rosea TaxID=2492390 RepID=UPI0013155EDF|nr:ankyrin repeat domain-containing protein [Elioraea rosea]